MSVRAWAHLHTLVSGDADLTYEALIDAAVAKGIRVVLLTEHQEALKPGGAEEAAARCRNLSDERLLLVPGLEISSAERYHVLGFGLDLGLATGPAVELADRMRERGAWPVLAHPTRYRPGWEATLGRIGAVEVWNRHYDGRVAPAKAVVTAWRDAPGVRAMFGLDAHGAEALVGSLPELMLDLDEVTEESVLSALRDGRFATAVAGRPVDPDGGGRDWAGEAYRRLRAAAKRLGYALPIPERARRRWGRRL